MGDAFWDGYRNQELRNMNRDYAEAIRTINMRNAQINHLHAEKGDLLAEIDNLRQRNADLEQEKADLGGHIQMWKAHYLSLEAERDYLLGLLDEANDGAENNPARKPAYADPDTYRIANGPRAGQPAEMRDHHYFSRLAELIRTKFPALGCWKQLIRANHIHD